jgi:hypothetical protein
MVWLGIPIDNVLFPIAFWKVLHLLFYQMGLYRRYFNFRTWQSHLRSCTEQCRTDCWPRMSISWLRLPHFTVFLQSKMIYFDQ